MCKKGLGLLLKGMAQGEALGEMRNDVACLLDLSLESGDAFSRASVDAPAGHTPAQVAAVQIELGTNRWLDLIRQASRNKD